MSATSLIFCITVSLSGEHKENLENLSGHIVLVLTLIQTLVVLTQSLMKLTSNGRGSYEGSCNLTVSSTLKGLADNAHSECFLLVPRQNCLFCTGFLPATLSSSKTVSQSLMQLSKMILLNHDTSPAKLQSPNHCVTIWETNATILQPHPHVLHKTPALGDHIHMFYTRQLPWKTTSTCSTQGQPHPHVLHKTPALGKYIHMFYTRHLPWITTSKCSTQDTCPGQPHTHVLHKTPLLGEHIQMFYTRQLPWTTTFTCSTQDTSLGQPHPRSTQDTSPGQPHPHVLHKTPLLGNHIHMFYTRHLSWATTSTCSTQDTSPGQPHPHVLHKTPLLGNHIHMFYTRHLSWATTSTCSTQDTSPGQPHPHVLHKTPWTITQTINHLTYLLHHHTFHDASSLRPTWARSRLVDYYIFPDKIIVINHRTWHSITIKFSWDKTE